METSTEPPSEPPAAMLPTLRAKDGTVVVQPRGLTMITEMARHGQPQAAIASALGMSTRVFRECRKRQPEVEGALAVGLAGLEHELVHSLLAAARKGHIAAAMFLLKTRHGYRETGQTDEAPKVAVQINLPAALDDRAYSRIVRAHSFGNADDDT